MDEARSVNETIVKVRLEGVKEEDWRDQQLWTSALASQGTTCSWNACIKVKIKYVPIQVHLLRLVATRLLRINIVTRGGVKRRSRTCAVSRHW